MKFQIDPTPGETQRGCSAVVQASLPPNQASLILIALYVAVFVAAFFLTPTTRITTAVTTFAIGPWITALFWRVRCTRLHLYLETDYVVAAADRLKRTGVRFEKDVHERAWGTREFVIKDDQGHMLYFGQPQWTRS